MKKSLPIILLAAFILSGNCKAQSPSRGLHVQWLSGLTYGISSYASCTDSISLCEVVIDTGLYGTSVSSTGPSAGIYTSNGYFVYTLPAVGDYTVLQHINTSGTTSGVYGYVHAIYGDSIPTTPAGCHASFFLAPDGTTPNEWVIYDFSTSSGTLTYYWNFGDGDTSTLANPTHTYGSLGNYLICLTISDGTCSDIFCDSAFYDPAIPGNGVLSLRTMHVTAGVREQPSAEFSLYPNPTDKEIRVILQNGHSGKDIFVSVSDLLGREVIPEGILATDKKVDVSVLESGVYLMKVRSGENLGVQRFVKR